MHQRPAFRGKVVDGAFHAAVLVPLGHQHPLGLRQKGYRLLRPASVQHAGRQRFVRAAVLGDRYRLQRLNGLQGDLHGEGGAVRLAVLRYALLPMFRDGHAARPAVAVAAAVQIEAPVLRLIHPVEGNKALFLSRPEINGAGDGFLLPLVRRLVGHVRMRQLHAAAVHQVSVFLHTLIEEAVTPLQTGEVIPAPLRVVHPEQHAARERQRPKAPGIQRLTAVFRPAAVVIRGLPCTERHMEAHKAVRLPLRPRRGQRHGPQSRQHRRGRRKQRQAPTHPFHRPPPIFRQNAGYRPRHSPGNNKCG